MNLMKTKKTIKNEIAYFRYKHDKAHPYAMISMSLLNDSRLSYLELGLMMKALSNADDFSFVASYNQEQSGFGQDAFYKGSKHLQELGYLIKTPKVGGGWKWIVIESKDTIETLKELKYITYDSAKKTWKVSDSKMYSMQIPDTVRSSDFPNTEIPTTDFPTTDFRNRDLTGKTINKETIEEVTLSTEVELGNNEITRASNSFAEADYKYEKKTENRTSDADTSVDYLSLGTITTSNTKIPVETTLPAKQHNPVGISTINDTSVQESSVADTSDWSSVVETTLPAKQNNPVRISTINDTSVRESSVTDTSDGTSVVETILTAKQNNPVRIPIINETSVCESSVADISDWSSVFETSSPAKQRTLENKPSNQNISVGSSGKDKRVIGNRFDHQGKLFNPSEQLDLFDNQYILNITENYKSYYFERDGVQIVLGLYNQLLNQDILKYHKVSFWKFEQMIILSHIDKLEKDNENVPNNNEELQLYVPDFNIDQFDVIFDYFKNNEEDFKKQIGNLNAKYSNFR